MKCPHHPRNEATGYCSVCGAFGCDECLHKHEGQVLCQKHYRPIAQEIEVEKKHEAERTKTTRQRLVVRYKEDRCERGVCFALNIRDVGFHLDVVDSAGFPSGETKRVHFDEIKAVFYVKSFTGKFNQSAIYDEWTPEGAEYVVKFKDSEVIHGFTLKRYRPEDKRFYLVPADRTTNNISILVEASAIERVYLPEEYKVARAQEQASRKKEDTVVNLSREETMGDFYFETRNYAAALKEYENAAQQHPTSRRLRKKVLVAKYDVGVQHIKRRNYKDALSCMEDVLKMDPHNAHAKKKAKQLQRIIERSKAS